MPTLAAPAAVLYGGTGARWQPPAKTQPAHPSQPASHVPAYAGKQIRERRIHTYLPALTRPEPPVPCPYRRFAEGVEP